MDFIWFGVVTSISSVVMVNIWSIILLCIPKVYTYEIKDITIIKAFLTKYKPYHAKRSESGLPSGYICGKWYVGLANCSQGNDNNITLLCSEVFYNDFNNNQKNTTVVAVDTNIIPVTKKSYYYVCSLTGTHFWGRQLSQLSDIIEPMGNQLACFNLINQHYTKHKITVCWLCGDANVGKSSVAKYAAQQLNGVLCTSYKPWMNHHTLSGVVISTSSSITQPLVILLDEVDKFLDKIIEKENSIVDKSHCEWTGDKPSWSRYWDDLHNPHNRHLIVILTSNTHYSHYDKLDNALLRQGRMDLRISMSEQITQVHDSQRFNFEL